MPGLQPPKILTQLVWGSTQASVILQVEASFLLSPSSPPSSSPSMPTTKPGIRMGLHSCKKQGFCPQDAH